MKAILIRNDLSFSYREVTSPVPTVIRVAEKPTEFSVIPYEFNSEPTPLPLIVEFEYSRLDPPRQVIYYER